MGGTPKANLRRGFKDAGVTEHGSLRAETHSGVIVGWDGLSQIRTIRVHPDEAQAQECQWQPVEERRSGEVVRDVD